MGMIDLINKGRCPSVGEMCRRFNIDKRTVYEDIKWIKLRGNLAIKHDRSRGGYINANPAKGIPTFDFTDEEFFALALSKKLTIRNSGGAFETPLDSVVGNIAKRRNSGQSQTEPEVNVSFRTVTPVNPFLSDIFAVLHSAKERCVTVEMQYHSANTDEKTTRKLDPYFIHERMGSWYVIGYCHLRKQTRNFALHRIQSCTKTKETFEQPADGELEKWLASSSQVEIRGPEQIVSLRFEPRTARFVREKQWHAQQKMTTLSDGSLQIEFPTRSLEEVKRWLMSYGAGGEAIAPKELRDLVAKELQDCIRLYKG